MREPRFGEVYEWVRPSGRGEKVMVIAVRSEHSWAGVCVTAGNYPIGEVRRDWVNGGIRSEGNTDGWVLVDEADA